MDIIKAKEELEDLKQFGAKEGVKESVLRDKLALLIVTIEANDVPMRIMSEMAKNILDNMFDDIPRSFMDTAVGKLLVGLAYGFESGKRLYTVKDIASMINVGTKWVTMRLEEDTETDYGFKVGRAFVFTEDEVVSIVNNYFRHKVVNQLDIDARIAMFWKLKKKGLSPEEIRKYFVDHGSVRKTGADGKKEARKAMRYFEKQTGLKRLKSIETLFDEKG